MFLFYFAKLLKTQKKSLKKIEYLFYKLYTLNKKLSSIIKYNNDEFSSINYI